MPRMDLLALTLDDLITLTNRGKVKRAQKELDGGDPIFQIEDDDEGDLVVAWSDGITCRFPSGKTVHEAVCSSGFIGISRHIVRSVLAYQRARSDWEATLVLADSGKKSDDETPALTQVSRDAMPCQIWDPGTFTDDDLIARFRKVAVANARKRFNQGVLVELTRGVKPTARFLDEACTLRFQVPGDLRYVTGDCAESLLPTRVPLAVWAFRQLPPHRLAGLLSLQQVDSPVPKTVLEDLDRMIDTLVREGFGNLAKTWRHRLMRIEGILRKEDLVWPAELVVDLLHQQDMYRTHDARFDPSQVVRLTGELLARTRAIASRTDAVPQLLIRGSKSDRTTEIAKGHMIGLGLGVEQGERHATLSAYLQETRSGNVLAVERTFVDPDPQIGDLPRSYTDLSGTVLSRGITLRELASSQLLVKSGKRSPSGLLILPRTAGSVSTNPQTFQWEQLKPPFAAESFAQLLARFESLPPSYLRPRQRTEDLHAVAVQGVQDVRFDVLQQCLTAMLHDTEGGTATLVHPFHSRGRDGFDQLQQVLENNGSQVRFVCGHVRTAGPRLEINPISVILDDGQRRLMVQPWVGNRIIPAEAASPLIEQRDTVVSPVNLFIRQLRDALADLLVTGVNHCDSTQWDSLAEYGRQLGFMRLIDPIEDLTADLAARSNAVRWNASNAVRWNASNAVRNGKQLCLLCRVAFEQS